MNPVKTAAASNLNNISASDRIGSCLR
jgi:hypothetical protein